MDAFLKNLILENLIKESQPEDEEERALLRTVLENNFFPTKQNPSSLYGRFEQEEDND